MTVEKTRSMPHTASDDPQGGGPEMSDQIICPSELEVDLSVYFRCTLPEGHDGPHQHLLTWADTDPRAMNL